MLFSCQSEFFCRAVSNSLLVDFLKKLYNLIVKENNKRIYVLQLISKILS